MSKVYESLAKSIVEFVGGKEKCERCVSLPDKTPF